MADIRIHIDVGQPLARLSRDLVGALQCASIGLSVRDSLTDPLLDLPNAEFQLRPAADQGWTAANVGPTYSRWILTNTLRDAVEAVSAFLEEIHRVLCAWSLSERDDQAVQISSQAYEYAFVKLPAKFHRLGLPGKLDYLAAQHSFALDPAHAAQLLSINAARNCFVHRGGIVGSRDITGPAGLEVQYTHSVLIVRNSDGEREVSLPVHVEAGDELGIAFRSVSKLFATGTTIDFSVQECSDICYTLLRISHGVHSAFSARFSARNANARS